MRTFVCSDHHFGWKSFYSFNEKYGHTLRPEFSSCEEADSEIIRRHNSVVPEFDSKVFFLGDVSRNMTNMRKVEDMNGQLKILILGNHDAKYRTANLLNYFDKVLGITYVSNRKFILTHCPIHPEELRDCTNIHGHVHRNSLKSSRYVNASLEPNNYFPLEIVGEEIVKSNTSI